MHYVWHRSEQKSAALGCFLARLPLAGPRQAVDLVYVFGRLGRRSVAKRFAVCLPRSEDPVDGEVSGSQSGLISFPKLPNSGGAIMER